MPPEKNNGLLCQECYNKQRREQQYHKCRNLTERMAKTCKYCGAPAMGGGRGAICRECYNRLQREKMKETYIPRRKYSQCKICGTMTRSQAGICNQCQGKKMPAKQNNSKEDEKALLETAVKYNREHPFHPAMMQNLVIAMQRMRGNCQPSGHCVTRR